MAGSRHLGAAVRTWNECLRKHARYQEAERYLLKDGNLRVPCSRYGRDTESCIPAALVVAEILEGETDASWNAEGWDYAMGLVVNDHDDVEYLIRNYGAEYGFSADDLFEEE